VAPTELESRECDLAHVKARPLQLSGQSPYLWISFLGTSPSAIWACQNLILCVSGPWILHHLIDNNMKLIRTLMLLTLDSPNQYSSSLPLGPHSLLLPAPPMPSCFASLPTKESSLTTLHIPFYPDSFVESCGFLLWIFSHSAFPYVPTATSLGQVIG
jgi:hypothetical protein